MLRYLARVASGFAHRRHYAGSWRKYSTPSLTRLQEVSVPCRSNGSISLRIHHPLVGSPGPSQPIIIYLPPGPVAPAINSGLDVASILSTTATATVVQINYRLSKEHKYPTCVHDVLRGYDWVVEHLMPARAFHRPGRSSIHTTSIAACGELIGGGLATMLALTECRISGTRVVAAAVNEPLVDWVFPEEQVADFDDEIDFDSGSGIKSESRSSKKTSRKFVPSFHAFGRNGILDAETLLQARSQLFRKAEDYFDPFASSTLFFRTSGQSIPSAPVVTPLDEFAELARFEREDFHKQQLKLSTLRSVSLSEDQPTTESRKPTRKSYKRWPSTASGLYIPNIRVGFGDTSPLADQAVELAMLVRRSIIAQNKKAAANDEEAQSHREAAFALAEQKAQIQATEGIRFWSDGQSPELRRVAQWLRHVLD